MFSSYDTLLLLLHLTRNLDTGDVGADTDVGGVSDMSVSSHGDSVSETSGSHDTSVVHIRGNSGDGSVEGLGLSLPLAVDIGMISGVSNHTVVDNGSDRVHGSVSDDSNIVKSSLSSSVSNMMSGSDLSDSVRLRLSLSLPLSVEVGISDHRMVDSSVREASYSSNTGIADTSDNTTSSAPSQHLSDGVGIRLAADGYSQEHCEEGTHGEC